MKFAAAPFTILTLAVAVAHVAAAAATMPEGDHLNAGVLTATNALRGGGPKLRVHAESLPSRRELQMEAPPPKETKEPPAKKETKEPPAKKEPKEPPAKKDPKEGRGLQKETKADPKEPKGTPKEPKAAPKEPKAEPKEPKDPKESKVSKGGRY